MKSTFLVLGLLAHHAAVLAADPVSVLFVGNSYTFGRVYPVMSYNAANVRDLTAPMWAANPSGSNAFEPHPWGGVAGIFKQFTVQAGLNYDVALSTRNAASLRGPFLNTNTAGWDLRGNIGAQAWNQVVLQEQSDEALTKRPGLASNPDYFRNYVDKIEDFIHVGQAHSYREREFFPGATTADQTAACTAATGASATTFFNALEGMTEELRLASLDAVALAPADASGAYAGIAPVGQTFMRAVQSGVATRDMWAAGAGTDGLIDLWFDDGTHASKYGSYLSALSFFGTVTGLDPASLGANEIAASELGISADDALALQRVASVQLGFAGAVPEPSAWLMGCLGLAGLMLHLRRGPRGAG